MWRTTMVLHPLRRHHITKNLRLVCSMEFDLTKGQSLYGCRPYHVSSGRQFVDRLVEKYL